MAARVGVAVAGSAYALLIAVCFGVVHDLSAATYSSDPESRCTYHECFVSEYIEWLRAEEVASGSISSIPSLSKSEGAVQIEKECEDLDEEKEQLQDDLKMVEEQNQDIDKKNILTDQIMR